MMKFYIIFNFLKLFHSVFDPMDDIETYHFDNPKQKEIFKN